MGNGTLSAQLREFLPLPSLNDIGSILIQMRIQAEQQWSGQSQKLTLTSR